MGFIYIYIYIYIKFTIDTEMAMATHSSTLAWKIPWTEGPGGLQSMGSLGVGLTEWLHFHFSLSYIGEGNGNPLQCSCLENPRDRGAWWAAVYGVTQSWTRLKRLSSSRSNLKLLHVGRYVHISTSTHISQLSQLTMRKEGKTDEMGWSGTYSTQMFSSPNTATTDVHLWFFASLSTFLSIISSAI